MISYLITSMLLSAIGWLAYVLLVRKKASALHQKIFIYFVLGSSLLLPLIGHQPLEKKPIPQPESTALAFGQVMKPAEAHLQHFCNCENPNFSHRISYRSNALFNLLLDNKHWLTAAILLALGIVMLRMMVQYLYLYRLLKRSRTEIRILGSKAFTLLHTEKPHGVGAFQLGKAYIIWQQEMEALSPTELNAVIQHELSHLRQRNTLEKSLLNLIQCFWLANPVFYYFRSELELISELIADQEGCKAIGSRKAYASLLIHLKELQTAPLASPFKGKGSLKNRIQRLLQDHRSHWGYPLVALLIVFGLQLAVVRDLSAQVDQTLIELETYEEIYIEHPREDALLYCPDCHSVCKPFEEINECAE